MFLLHLLVKGYSQKEEDLLLLGEKGSYLFWLSIYRQEVAKAVFYKMAVRIYICTLFVKIMEKKDSGEEEDWPLS